MRRRIIGLVCFALLGSVFAMGSDRAADRRDIRHDRRDLRNDYR